MTHAPGSFCTSVLRTRDAERAGEFYAALMGWTVKGVAGAAEHRLFESDGKTVAGIQQVGDDNDIWIPHVSVEDINQSIANATALGATLLDTRDYAGFARLASLNDLEGATFGLWEPQPHVGADFMEQVGSLWWIEVLSNDVSRACAIYERLFGWTSTARPLEPFDSYTFFKRGDVHEGGLLPIGPDWGVSPRWNSIFAVEDGNATIARAVALGGCEIFTHTVPKAGLISVLEDPGGAGFVIRGPEPA